MTPDEDALQRLKAAKAEKTVNRTLANCEIEIAKAIAAIALTTPNVTEEVIKILSAICISTTERYMASDEDQKIFLQALHQNIDDLYSFMKDANAEDSPEITGGD